MTGPDDLDEMLASLGADWRADQPPLPEIDPESIMSEARRWRPSRLTLAGSGTAVAAAVAALLVITLGGGESAGPAPATSLRTSTARTPFVAPTAELPQGSAAITWPDGVTTPECVRADLRVERSTQYAMGQAAQQLTRVLLHNISGRECALRAEPSIASGLREDGSTVQITAKKGTYFDQPSVLPDLLPGETGAVNLETAMGCGQTATSPAPDPLENVTLELPGGDATINGPFDDRCRGLFVGPFYEVAPTSSLDDGWDVVSSIYGAQSFQRLCSAADLTLIGTGGNAASSHEVTRFVVRNDSKTGCSLSGAPHIVSRTYKDGHVVSGPIADGTYEDDLAGFTSIAPGQTAAVGVETTDGACPNQQTQFMNPDPVTRIDVRPPGGGNLSLTGIFDDRCELSVTNGWYAVERIPATDIPANWQEILPDTPDTQQPGSSIAAAPSSQATSPGPSESPLVRTCESSQLVASDGGINGAGGLDYYYVDVRNTSSATCEIYGSVTSLTALTSSGADHVVPIAPAVTGFPADGPISPGKSASVTVFSPHYCEPKLNTTVFTTMVLGTSEGQTLRVTASKTPVREVGVSGIGWVFGCGGATSSNFSPESAAH